jgi:hypothetical protein
MKKDELNASETELTEQNDELRLEYDLSQLQVRRLEPDVAAVFPDADAVNEALRLLIEIAQSTGQSQQAA